jgi:hypothetical protein
MKPCAGQPARARTVTGEIEWTDTEPKDHRRLLRSDLPRQRHGALVVVVHCHLRIRLKPTAKGRNLEENLARRLLHDTGNAIGTMNLSHQRKRLEQQCITGNGRGSRRRVIRIPMRMSTAHNRCGRDVSTGRERPLKNNVRKRQPETLPHSLRNILHCKGVQIRHNLKVPSMLGSGQVERRKMFTVNRNHAQIREFRQQDTSKRTRPGAEIKNDGSTQLAKPTIQRP